MIENDTVSLAAAWSWLDWATVRRGSQWAAWGGVGGAGLVPEQGYCYWSHVRVSHDSQNIETLQHLWMSKTSGCHNLYLSRVCNIFNEL